MFYKFLFENITYDEAKQLFGLPDNFTINDVKKAYTKLAKKFHPDRGGELDKMQDINYARELLSNKNVKKSTEKYDFDETEDDEKEEFDESMYEEVDNSIYHILHDRKTINKIYDKLDSLMGNDSIVYIKNEIANFMYNLICDDLEFIIDDIEFYDDKIQKNIAIFVEDLCSPSYLRNKSSEVIDRFLKDLKTIFRKGVDIEFDWR